MGLTLKRGVGQAVIIEGSGRLVVTVDGLQGGAASLTFDGPKSMHVRREELPELPPCQRCGHAARDHRNGRCP